MVVVNRFPVWIFDQSDVSGHFFLSIVEVWTLNFVLDLFFNRQILLYFDTIFV
jgi:hypothetical protein